MGRLGDAWDLHAPGDLLDLGVHRLLRLLEAGVDRSDDAIQGELEAYNPLVPDGANWKATMFVEYPDAEERRRMLARLKGIERRVWVQAGEGERVYAIADEDLERENEEKTSSVHFLRFELSADARAALRRGAAIRIGVDHPHYSASLAVDAPVRESLAGDLA